ncbi:MAG: hypothetical protein D4R65_10815 [Verrucomicrobiaceae bacterium]|nr:MAG: hypothetical protein D4R65_10815 [Verrucomicrobiaceae bacterium]
MTKQRQQDIPSTSLIFQKLMESHGPLVKQGLLTENILHQRAQWLHEDLGKLHLAQFQILPTREVTDPASGLLFKMVEYVFGPSGHDLDQAAPGFKKNPHFIDGTGLDRESLSRFARISETGHTVIPHLWLGNKTLRERVRTPTQHLDTLNEVWWLSRWHGVIPDSVEMEYPLLGGAKKRTPTVDWRFRVLDGVITINLEVKNRRGTAASKPMKKGVYLFGDQPGKPFRPSTNDEINVLAITGYHAGAISPREEDQLVKSYLDETPAGEVLDAVSLYVVGQGSRERLFFPTNRPLHKKDLILRSLLKTENIEDHSRILLHRVPMSWEDLGIKPVALVDDFHAEP